MINATQIRTAFRAVRSSSNTLKLWLPVLLAAGFFFTGGCGKKAAPQANTTLETINNTEPAPASAPPNVSAPAAGVTPVTVVESVDTSAQLAQLTQVLRRFGMDQRRVPQSLNELVAAGYLAALPVAAGGKHFAIDAKHMQVVLQ